MIYLFLDISILILTLEFKEENIERIKIKMMIKPNMKNISKAYQIKINKQRSLLEIRM